MSKANIVKGIKETTKEVQDSIYRSKLTEKIKYKLHKLTTKDRNYLVEMLK